MVCIYVKTLIGKCRNVISYHIRIKQTWAMKWSSVEQIKKAEMRMVRWMCRASICERKKNEDLLKSMGLVRIGQVMRKSRLRWYGHVARSEEIHWLQRILNFPVAGRKPHGRPRKTWEETITEDRRASNITHIDPTDRTAIKEMNCPTPQSGKMETIMMEHLPGLQGQRSLTSWWGSRCPG